MPAAKNNNRQARPPSVVLTLRGGGRPGPAAPPVTPPVPVPGGDGGIPAWAGKMLQEILTPAFWFDPGQDGDPYRVTIWFSGRRAQVSGKPGPGDAFTQEVTVEGVVPGSGPVAVTPEVRGINPGDWVVTARSVSRAGCRTVGPHAADGEASPPRGRGIMWPRRVAVPRSSRATLSSALLPFTKVPGIVRLAYPVLVVLGVLAGLGLQAALLTRARLPAGPALVFSVYAVAGGLAGAKAWYIAVHRGRRFEGWCIQGFVAGAAAVAALAPTAGLGVPARAYYAAAAPGLLIGMAIGRPGCFWAGCCTGRPTASRWGIWSSDRGIGCRRFPTQLLEALLALITGLATLTVVLLLGPARSGPVAVAALAAYTLGRQFILGLRADPPRRSPRSGLVTATAAAAVLIASIVVLAAGGA